MSNRLRERILRHSWRGGGRSGDEGVSPVVGMIMVLAISVVGISAILYWGLPAIDEMKANVEFRGVQNQFEELDATVKELVAGTTEKTAKRWQPTLNRGHLSVHNNTESWLFAVDAYNATLGNDFVWANLSDGNDTISIQSKNRTDNVKVEAFIIHGTSSSTTLNVTGGAAVWPAQMVKENLTTWQAGEWKHFMISQNGQRYNLANATFKFRILNGTNVVAEAWYASTGRIDFALDAGLGNKAVVANNGAVITGVNGAYTIVNSPPIPPPSNTSGVPRIFGRLILLGGDAQFTGTETFDLLVSLYATATLASYDCALSTRSDCVGAVKYYNYGTYGNVWYKHLTNQNRGYGFSEKALDYDANAKYLEDRRPYMGFTLLQSSLKAVNG